MKEILKKIFERFNQSKAKYLKIDLGWRKSIEFEKSAPLTKQVSQDTIIKESYETTQQSESSMELFSLYVGKFRKIKESLEVGEVVKQGEVLGSVESMGISHDIISATNGVIKEVNVKNGDVVEYDQLLFRIKEEL